MRKNLRKLFMGVLLIVCVNVMAIAQTAKVSGVVSDSKGGTLPGVSVVIKGTTNGTITDIDGKFVIGIPDGTPTLVFSFVGMETQEVNVAGKTEFKIVLRDASIGLDELVVVGYGAQKKVNLTGSVSSVNFADQAGSRPVTTVSSALAGLSSGVTIRQGTGKPGEDGASIRIRGTGTLNNSSPLIIIDGMEGVLDAINPNDIASISVLKDAASCAIYGSRAANGVILVTTKKGDKEHTSVTYSGTYSFAKPSNLLEFVSDYPTYMKLMNESARNIGTADVFSSSTIEQWEAANKNPNALTENGVPNWLAFPNTNWNKEVYENNLIQDHTVSVSGGSKSSTFLLSVGYLDNQGLVENTGLKRYTLRANLEADVSSWLKIGTRTYAIMQDKELGDYKSLLNFARQSTPGGIGQYNGQYGYPEAPGESATANNLFVHLNRVIGDDKSSRFNTTVYSKVALAKGLSWDFNFNYAKRFDEYNSHTNPNAGERIKFSTGDIMSPMTESSQLSTYYKTYSNYSYTLENLLRYTTTIAEDHDISSMVGYNENYYFSYYHSSSKKGLIDESVSTPGSATEMIGIGGSATDNAIRSVFGRVNYGYKQRYLFEANMRYDGSSRFHEDSRWGVFPSFSAAWRMSEENFMKDQEWLQNLKLRLSWGKLGNNVLVANGGKDSGNYYYQALYGKVNYSFNGVQVAGLRPGKISNSFLEWESTTVSNLGIDASILDGRLTAELDVYNKVTDGILTTPPIYLTLGVKSAPTKNTAEVTNQGVEFTLGWRDQIGDVKYSVSGNFAYNINEVTSYKGKLDQGWRTDDEGNKYYYSNLGDVSSGGSTRVLEGHMINEYLMYGLYNGSGNHFNTDGTVNIKGGPQDGMIRTEQDMAWLEAMVDAGYEFMPNQKIAKNRIWYGDYIYADSNNDGVYGNSNDRTFQGQSSTPKFSFGSQINVSYKNFDLGMNWAGNAGFKLYWNESGYNRSNTRYGCAIGEIIADNHYYYNEENPNDHTNNLTADYPRLKMNEGDSQNTQASTRWLYDGSYLKLKNLTIGYTLPKDLAKRIKTESVRVYFSAENLLTITSFPGMDPEMGASTNYPSIKQIAFGTNVTF